MDIGCPYLEAGSSIKVCNASATLLAPSVEKKERYCATEEHYRCAILLGHVMRSGKRGAGNRPGADCADWAQK